jgi:hypothetical protein
VITNESKFADSGLGILTLKIKCVVQFNKSWGGASNDCASLEPERNGTPALENVAGVWISCASGFWSNIRRGLGIGIAIRCREQ